MDTTNITVWLAIALVITMVITRLARGRIYNPVCNKPVPPVVTGVSLIGLTHLLIKKGFQAMIHDQYDRLGSVFTVRFLGTIVTFLIGPEVSSQFYQAPNSEISHGKFLEFTAPMFGKEVGHAVDVTIRNEQIRFMTEALKPSNLRSHVVPMLQEVQSYFAEWGQEGVFDLEKEVQQLLMLITARCLLGKEVREKMFDKVLNLFHELTENSMGLTSLFFPYAPTPANCRRDKAHAKLFKLFAEIVRSRRSTTDPVEEDVLQYLIEARYQDGRPTTEGEVTGMIMSLIFAGEHTSSTTSTWTGAHLLSNPSWLAAAVEEQEQIMEKHGEKVDFNVLQQMDTLYRCIKETLRICPPTTTFFRTVHKDFAVRTREGVEYEILSGHMLASPLLFNHKLSYIYKDPEVYDPDRFGPGREEDKAGGKFSYVPFSGGKHACPGQNYAYMQIKIIWSHLLRNFELELV